MSKLTDELDKRDPLEWKRATHGTWDTAADMAEPMKSFDIIANVRERFAGAGINLPEDALTLKLLWRCPNCEILNSRALENCGKCEAPQPTQIDDNAPIGYLFVKEISVDTWNTIMGAPNEDANKISWNELYVLDGTPRQPQ